MAASEDELAKKQVQEAVWMWTGRIVVLAATFGFGFFGGWYLWARGFQGAPALREKVQPIACQRSVKSAWAHPAHACDQLIALCQRKQSISTC